MLNKRSLVVSFIVTVSCCLLLIVVTFKGDSSREIIASREISQQPENPIFVKYRRCLLNSMRTLSSEEVWSKSMALVNSCMEKYDMEKRLPLMGLENNDETKYVLNTFPKLETGEECNVVTLGVGKDIGAEMQLSKHLSPLCHFHGADPSAKDNEQIYTKIGSFYPFAIAATNGIRTASLFVPESSSYVASNISHISIVDFFKDHAKVKVIDFLLMDAESAEFDMVPFFLPGGLLDQNEIVICQWTCEFHAGDETTHKQYTDFMLKNVFSGWYLPIKFYSASHIRATLINDRNELCLRRYINNSSQ